MALLLGGPPRHAGNLEGVRVVAQHQQLVAAAERHAGGHVEVPAHIAARVVGLVLFLVNFQQDVAPMGPAEQSPRRRGPSPTPTRSHGRAGGAGTQRRSARRGVLGAPQAPYSWSQRAGHRA